MSLRRRNEEPGGARRSRGRNPRAGCGKKAFAIQPPPVTPPPAPAWARVPSFPVGGGEGISGRWGELRPPTSQTSYPRSAMYLRILASQSAERPTGLLREGQGVRPEAGFSAAR